MSYLAALLAAFGVFLVLTTRSSSSPLSSLDRYLLPTQDDHRDEHPPWYEALMPAVPWVVAGGFCGVLLAQGDLFLTGPGRSIPGLALVGGAAGWFVYSAVRTTRNERVARRLRFELPVMTDAIALQIVAGESVATAIDNVCAVTSGVVHDELVDVLKQADSTASLPDALSDASAATAHADARRLYAVLAHAHTAGGRVSTSLSELALDYRAGLERDVTEEGGRRAIAAYGPVLVLMVPTALLFLLYPTILGLRALSGSP